MHFNKGRKLSDEHKKKIGEANRRIALSQKRKPPTREGTVPWNKGLKGYNSGEKSPSWKGGKINCKECGKQLHRRTVPSGLCMPCGNKLRFTGESNPNWKNGISRENKRERAFLMQTREYRLWRKAVLERDGNRCTFCGNGNGKTRKEWLEVDHIKSWKNFPELRFAIDNGRTLCMKCHIQTENWGARNWN